MADSDVIVLPNPPDQPGDGLPSPTAELDAQRRLTEYFIQTQPRQIDLTPRASVRTSSGGRVWALGTPRGAQTMRLVEPVVPNPPLAASDGVQRQVEFILIGRWDAEIGRFDIFSLDDRDWEVAELYHFNGWERRAAVVARG